MESDEGSEERVRQKVLKALSQSSAIRGFHSTSLELSKAQKAQTVLAPGDKQGKNPKFHRMLMDERSPKKNYLKELEHSKQKVVLVEMFVLGESYDLVQVSPSRAQPNVHPQPMVEVGSSGSYGAGRKNQT